MMRQRWCGERHEIAGTDFELFTVNLGDSATGQNVQPFFFMLVRVIDKGFLSGGHAGDAHRRSLQSEGAAELHANQLRVRVPGMGEGLFTLLDLKGVEYQPFRIRHLFHLLFAITASAPAEAIRDVGSNETVAMISLRPFISPIRP